MSVSTIKITFTEDLILDDRLFFSIRLNANTSPLDFNNWYKWVNVRSSGYQVTLGTPVLDSVGERAAINFKQAFELDNAWLINSGKLSISRNVNEILITAPNQNDLTLFILGTPPYGLSTDPSIEIEIVDGTYSSFVIDEVVVSEASVNKCQNALFTIETSSLATKILSPVVVNPNTENPFSFEWPRGLNFTLTIEDSSGNQINEIIESPSILSPNNFVLQINNSPNGATVIVENNTSVGLIFEYSLDNSTWQNENTFSGLAEGDYTVYIKDQLGCSSSIDFNVSEFGVYDPFFYISKSNSIRFANRITFGDASNYKNDENTLSCESVAELPYMEVQQFQTADIITTQFKSNYDTNTAKVIRENGSEVSVSVVKKSTNIGNKDLRDARKYDLGSGKTGIYFLSGNIYDFDTTIDTGEDYFLNGALPIWAKSGVFVQIDSEWFLIEDILYDDDKNAEIIVISSNYSGPDVSIIAGAIYNIFDYEIYEFTIDMVDYIDELINVKITAEDDNFETLIFLSEKIEVKVRHEDCLEIEYWNDDNTDVFYSTGITHLIRVPFTKIADASEEESENNKSDATTVLLSSNIYEGTEFTFEPTTLEIMRKLRIGLSCKNVFIDDVRYVKAGGNFDVEGPLEKSNLYVLKAKMIKSGSSFSSQSEGLSDFNSSNSEIPGLIDIGSGGYVRY